MNGLNRRFGTQFRLRTLLIMFTIVTVGVGAYLQLLSVSLSASIRRDLEVKPNESLSILESTHNSSGENEYQQALIMIADAKEYRLARASRLRDLPNPNQARWCIDSVNVMTTDGHCISDVFERTLDHEPTKQEIAEFKQWVDRW